MNNQLKTFLLLLALTALVLFIGSLFGKAGLIVAFILVCGMNLVSYFWSDKIVLAMYRAKPASKKEYPRLHSMVEELAKEAKIPKPSVYVISTRLQNAFATGRNPKHAAIAVTTGLMENLNSEELKGVLAHEISHVKNRDILISTIAATLAGVIMFVANMARFAAIAGTSEDRRGTIGLILFSILAPLAALLIQMAISRSREFIADESGARLMGNGEPLASALLKLEKGPKVTAGLESTAHLFIVNPLSARGITNLFSTHPPIAERVKRLRALKFSK